MSQSKEILLSNKHTGFESLLSFKYLSLPKLADFFFAYLGPLSDSNYTANHTGVDYCQPFFISLNQA